VSARPLKQPFAKLSPSPFLANGFGIEKGRPPAGGGAGAGGERRREEEDEEGVESEEAEDEDEEDWDEDEDEVWPPSPSVEDEE